MRIAPITPVATSSYANRNEAISNVGYYVELHRGEWTPVVYGKLREPCESPWLAMQEAKTLAHKIAGAMRQRGIRARAVQIHNTPVSA